MPAHFALVLHAHLPFVRHPEYARSLEERWLYEAIIECYLPLLDVFHRLKRERVPFRVTMSITPPLAAMLKDELLQERAADHLARLIALADQEADRVGEDPAFEPVVAFYRERLVQMQKLFDAVGRDIVGAYRKLWDEGHLELIACSATHAYLPGLLPTRRGIQSQLALGMQLFSSYVGRTARGMWLPECAYDPAFDHELARAGVEFTVVDTHAVARATPPAPFGPFAPIVSPAGVAFFPRDARSSEQVWSREIGYPGDPYYRDFYRDIGYDLGEEHLRGELGPDGRVMTGLKYYRITGREVPGNRKAPYEPVVALERTRAHAAHFVRGRLDQVEAAAGPLPVIVAPYDAELFGHWWFEGPNFIEAVFRELAWHADRMVPTTLGDHLAEAPLLAQCTPLASSWGEGGFGEVWVGARTGHLWRHVHHATKYVTDLVRAHPRLGGHAGLALDQMIRELLLLQSSDWPFIIHTQTTVGYAEARIRAHTHRLRHLGHLATRETLTKDELAFISNVRKRDTFAANLSSRQLREPLLSID